jgi:dephospho-CoA kinase
VQRVLITGMSGTGKSTVLRELAARGFKTVDTDYGGWTELVDMPPGVRSADGGTQEWLWKEERMANLLSAEDAEVLFVSGAARNQGRFYPLFDRIILLTAPAAVILERLASRTNNPYGKLAAERDQVIALKDAVEPHLRRTAHMEIDTSVPLQEVVARILATVQD